MKTKSERLGPGRYKTEEVEVCRNCKGAGTLDNKDTCGICEGTGKVLIIKEININIKPYKNDTNY